MIRIQKIHIHEFRGIRDLALDLGSENFAVCGPNGTGKSGVVDAIEFALTGNISRLSGRGTRELSIKEHGPHVDSRSKPEEAYVALTFKIVALNKEAIITRTVKAPSKPTITPDDPQVKVAIEQVWLKVLTNDNLKAAENSSQGKSLDEYRQLMAGCFEEAYRLLKLGRWLTVEFSNTNASVWNSIQTALTEVGFIVANVSSLNKKQGSFKAVTTPTAVKQDLIISAYKPNGGFEERFQKEAQTEEGVWDFVRTHLKYLPITKRQGTLMLFVPERGPRILFDQMIAYYVRKGYLVPISSQEFQIGLAQRFIERDGMYFLSDQVAEYDRKKMTSGELTQMSMFVSDEASAIQWLRQLIKGKPQTFSDINPQFMQQLGGWSKNKAKLDLCELLNQNFLCYDGKGSVPEQIHAYLSTNWKELRNLPKDDPALVAKARDCWYVPDPNKAGDLEKLCEKALLKEFEEYKEVKKKLKVFRLEAIRAGFKKAWRGRDYAVIVAVADKISNNVVEKDPKLLMWYD